MPLLAGLVLVGSLPFTPAHAQQFPAVMVTPAASMPACVTPGRLQSYLESRNPSLARQFQTIAADYMRHGEELGIRWDYAFYQMILETGSLSFMNNGRRGDVDPSQNNFAGLGATGNGAPGEAFPDVSIGVRAHLEHLRLYAGQPVSNPVAERTRKVAEWRVLDRWQQGFRRPIHFGDLAQKWAPGSRSYSQHIASIAQKFNDEFCNAPDAKPELLALARGQGVFAMPPASRQAETRQLEATAPMRSARSEVVENEVAPSPAPSGKALAASANRNSENRRLALGASGLAKSMNPPVRILNAPVPDDASAALTPPPAASAAEPPSSVQAPVAKQGAPAPTKTAFAAGAAKSGIAAGPSKCRVFTASYGGHKAMIVRAVNEGMVNYTVLDVNEGREKREAEAFISAYAKDGRIAGEFASQAQALEKAFELCPEK